MNVNQMDIQEEVTQLEKNIDEANPAYRTGDAIVPDSVYDSWIDRLSEIDPFNERLVNIGYHISDDDERKQKLPIDMASMEKFKLIDTYYKWLKAKNIPLDTLMVCTPKFDGASFCSDENNGDSWTRGDGTFGQFSPKHYQAVQNRGADKNPYNCYSYGEIIVPIETFLNEKFTKEDGSLYKNPRNLAAGKLNDDEPNENILKHFYYIRYGMHNTNLILDKVDQLELLNTLNAVPVKYETIKASDVTEAYLIGLFNKWKGQFEMDGIIIEVNDYYLREELGRESDTNRNPAYARAFKGDGFEDKADTPVIAVPYEVSKQGYLFPTVSVVPVLLNGALVSNPTGNNFKFIQENGIGPGAIVTIIRSGMVIPKIIKVVKPAQVILPTNCPSCNSIVDWNHSGVHLVCTNGDCETQRLQKIIAFFEILGADNMGEGICEQLYNAGYDTVAKILNMTQDEMKSLDKFGERRAQIIFDSVRKATTNIPLSKLQHASGCFQSLGSKKLELLTDYNETSTVKEIVKINGFSEILATNFLKGIVKFNEFIIGLPVTTQKKIQQVITGDKCKGWNVVFTGFTNKDMEKFIIENEGVIGSGISKKTTHLVMKQKGSGSSKEQKAMDLNVPIFEEEEFKKLIL